MDEPVVSWRDALFRRSVLGLVALTLLAVLVGFVWLPSASGDFGAQGLWASICRAAGVPVAWGGAGAVKAGPPATTVVLERAMIAPSTPDAVGRGATLALNCTMCHGAQGLSSANVPNLSGQYAEVVVKQLHDYRDGRRSSAVMQALARGLGDRDIDDLAAYFAWLPKARKAPTTYADELPALVRTGAPLRNVAPCIACHGSVDQKLGAPWLEGMPRDYLFTQLLAFHDGTRANDSHAQMRNMARSMTLPEIAEVAAFYARDGR